MASHVTRHSSVDGRLAADDMSSSANRNVHVDEVCVVCQMYSTTSHATGRCNRLIELALHPETLAFFGIPGLAPLRRCSFVDDVSSIRSRSPSMITDRLASLKMFLILVEEVPETPPRGRHFRLPADISFTTQKDYSTQHPFEIEEEEPLFMSIKLADTKDPDLVYFHQACSILQYTIFNATIPQHMWDIEPTKESRHMAIYSTIAMILSTRSTGKDVCAVTCEINLDHDPPQFDLLVAKNKDISTTDEENARRLIDIVREYAAGDDSTGFFHAVFGLIKEIQLAKWEKLARTVLAKTQTLQSVVCDVVSTLIAKRTNHDESEDLNGDTFLRQQARERNVDPLISVLVNMQMTNELAERIQDPDEPDVAQKLIDFSAVCNVLATSRLFRNIGPHLQPRDLEDMRELFDNYSFIGSFWSGIDLLREHCVTEQYRESLQHLNYRGVNIPTGKDLRTIAQKYSLHLSQKVDGGNEDLDDFYELVRLRSKSQRRRLQRNDLSTGWRKDWIRKYPKLEGLCMDDPSEMMHAEVKLGLHLLAKGHTFPRAIGISKSPCYLCKSWFEAASSLCGEATFHIPTSHEKVYSGWQKSRIEELDRHVSAKVWETFDNVMWKVKRVQTKDATLPTYRMAVDGVEKICQFEKLDTFYAEWSRFPFFQY